MAAIPITMALAVTEAEAPVLAIPAAVLEMAGRTVEVEAIQDRLRRRMM